MLWVLIKITLMRLFQWVPTMYVCFHGGKWKIVILFAKEVTCLELWPIPKGDLNISLLKHSSRGGVVFFFSVKKYWFKMFYFSICINMQQMIYFKRIRMKAEKINEKPSAFKALGFSLIFSVLLLRHFKWVANHFAEAFQMSSHNICFCEEIKRLPYTSYLELCDNFWDSPRGFGDRGTSPFIAGKQGNKILKMKGTGEQRQFWGKGTQKIKTLIVGNRGKMPIVFRG